jgi:hypothetical protein
MREGFDFLGDQLVTLPGPGSFETSDGQVFCPRFLVTDHPPELEGGTEKHSPAVAAFTLASYRLGPIDHPELLELLKITSDLRALGGPRPREVARELRTSP